MRFAKVQDAKRNKNGGAEMEERYNLNDVALMTGFTTRTLRNYMNQGLLKGEKINSAWQFSLEDLDKFFNEPFVKEGLRIKRSGIVFDFMAARKKESPRACVILDIPVSLKKGNEISAFFCEQLNNVENVRFSYEFEKGSCRVILSGAAGAVERILKEYYASGHAASL